MKTHIISSMLAILAIRPCMADTTPNIESAILKFIPYGITDGVTPNNVPCTVNLPDGPGVYWIVVGDLGETGQNYNGHWSSGHIYPPARQDKYQKITAFFQDENSLRIRSEDSSERQYVPILPSEISELIIEAKSDGTKSIQVRSGSSFSLGWRTDYTCIIK